MYVAFIFYWCSWKWKFSGSVVSNPSLRTVPINPSTAGIHHHHHLTITILPSLHHHLSITISPSHHHHPPPTIHLLVFTTLPLKKERKKILLRVRFAIAHLGYVKGSLQNKFLVKVGNLTQPAWKSLIFWWLVIFDVIFLVGTGESPPPIATKSQQNHRFVWLWFWF